MVWNFSDRMPVAVPAGSDRPDSGSDWLSGAVPDSDCPDLLPVAVPGSDYPDLLPDAVPDSDPDFLSDAVPADS